MSRRNGRMIWVRILRVGMVNLANAAPALGAHRVGRKEEDQLVGPAVFRRKAVRDHGMRIGVACGDPDRNLGNDGSGALVVQSNPFVEDPSANAVRGEAASCCHGGLRTTAVAAVAAVLWRSEERRVGNEGGVELVRDGV